MATRTMASRNKYQPRAHAPLTPNRHLTRHPLATLTLLGPARPPRLGWTYGAQLQPMPPRTTRTKAPRNRDSRLAHGPPPPRARRARPCFAAQGGSAPRSKEPTIPPTREAFCRPASPSRPSFNSDIFIFINHRPTGPSAELFLATMSCSFAAARHPLQPLPITTTEDTAYNPCH